MPPESMSVTDQQGPGHRIEEELATALGEGVVDSVEQADHAGDGHGQLEQSAEAVAAEDGDTEVNPDMANIISEIMDHTERQEHSVMLGQQEIPQSSQFNGAKGFAFLKANSHLKIQSLPILDNLVSLFAFDCILFFYV